MAGAERGRSLIRRSTLETMIVREAGAQARLFHVDGQGGGDFVLF